MDRLITFERRHHKLASWSGFVRRFAVNFSIAFAVIGAALAFGMAGYMYFGKLGVIDAFLNAAMILSGMGPVDKMDTSAAKLFAGCYALASGLIVVAATGLILAPVFHRVLHHFHCGEDDHV